MARFTFTSEEFAGTKTTVEFHAENMDKVLENFKQFLQGSGFILGVNDVVEVNDTSWQYQTSDISVPSYPEDFNFPYQYDEQFLNSSTADINFNFNDEVSITVPEEPTQKKGKK
jgi:hypothetical protein